MYNFLLDVGQYAIAIINVLVIIGLFIIRRKPTPQPTFRAWTPIVYLFFASQIFLLITPFVPTALDRGKALPPWLYSVVAILILSGAVIYWLVLWVVLPTHGKFVWTARKSILSDGSSVVSWDKVKVS